MTLQATRPPKLRVEPTVTPEIAGVEAALIGCMLIEPACIPRIAALVEPEDFSFSTYQHLFRALVQAKDKKEPLDEFTAVARLCEITSISPEEARRLVVSAVRLDPYTNEAERYAAMVANSSGKRRGARLGHEISGLFQGEQSFEEAVSEAEARLQVLRSRAKVRQLGGLTAPELMQLEFPPTRWAVPGIFSEGLCILAGKSKMGKSWLVYQIAAAVALGGVALGELPVDGGRVLYLALEDSNRRLKDRLHRILDGAAPPERLHLFNRWPRMHEGGRRDLISWFRQHPDTRLVIIDTFAKIRSIADRPGNAYDEDYKAMGEIKHVADDHGATILVIHHFNKMKPSEDWVDSVSGSIGISGAADGIVGFFRERGQPNAILKITGREIDDESDKGLGWREHGGPWSLQAVEAAAYARNPEQEAVLQLLTQVYPRALQPRQVAQALERNPSTIRSMLFRMALEGLVVQPTEHTYTLPSDTAPQNGAVFATAATRNTRNGATDQAPAVAGVAGVAPVAGVAENGHFASNGNGFHPPDELPEPLELDPDTPPEEAELRHNTFRLAWTKGYPGVQLNATHAIDPGEDAWRHACRVNFEGWIEMAYARLNGGRRAH